MLKNRSKIMPTTIPTTLPAPFPPIPIPIIIEGVKTIWKFIKSIGNETPVVNERSTAQDIEQTSVALDRMRQNILSGFRDSLTEINASVDAFLSELTMRLESREDVLHKYRYSQREFNKIIREIRDGVARFWEERLSRYISLDNPACCRILNMPAGERRSEMLQDFIATVLNDIAEDYRRHLLASMTILHEELSEDVDEMIAQIDGLMKEYAELSALQEGDNKEQYEAVLAQARRRVFLYERISTEMEV